MSLPATPSIWVVSDGTRGMEVQSLALARALDGEVQLKRIRPAPWLRAFPSLGAVPFVPASAGGDSLRGDWPDLAIGCGRRNAGAVLSVKARSGGRTRAVQIQDPRIAPELFDALIVPEHDPVRGGNVLLSTGSLNALAFTDLKAEARRFEEMIRPLRGFRVLVCVGGATRRQAVDPALSARFIEDLTAVVDRGCSLMITASRRSPETLVAGLRELAAAEPGVTFWDGEGENPYFAFLGAADAIIVTSDSVNMASEACSTGKAVYIADLLRPRGRIEAFHEHLRQSGRSRPFTGVVEPFVYTPLDDAREAAAALRRLFRGGSGIEPQ